MDKQYCACCIDDEEVYFYGLGSTPSEAYDEFVVGGQFECQCDDWLVEKGEYVEVYIYTIVQPKDSDWPDDEFDPGWEFVLDMKIETRVAKAP